MSDYQNFAVMMPVEYRDGIESEILLSSMKEFGVTSSYIRYIDTTGSVNFKDLTYEFLGLYDKGVILSYLPKISHNSFMNMLNQEVVQLNKKMSDYRIVNLYITNENDLSRSNGILIENQYLLVQYDPTLVTERNIKLQDLMMGISGRIPTTSEYLFYTFTEYWVSTVTALKNYHYLSVRNFMHENEFETDISSIKLLPNSYVNFPIFFVNSDSNGRLHYNLYSISYDFNPFFRKWNDKTIKLCDFVKSNGVYEPELHFVGVTLPKSPQFSKYLVQTMIGVLGGIGYVNEKYGGILGKYYVYPYILPSEDKMENYIQGIKIFVDELKGNAIFGGYQ